MSYAIAEAGFYGVIPFATPNCMNVMASIFGCGHCMHLACILSNWYDFCRPHNIYGIRPVNSFPCPMYRAALSMDAHLFNILENQIILPCLENGTASHIEFS